MAQSRESKQSVDLTLNKPRTIDRANCITARYDAGSVIAKKKEPVLLSQMGARFEKKINVANTLLARDYKGFGNQSMNGVIAYNGENNK